MDFWEKKKHYYKSEEYSYCITELFVSVSVRFSPSSVCSKVDDRGVHWSEGQLLHLILFFTSVSLSLLHTQLQMSYAAGNWTLLIQFKSSHIGRKREKQTNSRIILDWSSAADPAIQKKPEALMKFWLINLQCTIISLCEDSEKYWEYFISKSKKNLLKCAKNINFWG